MDNGCRLLLNEVNTGDQCSVQKKDFIEVKVMCYGAAASRSLQGIKIQSAMTNRLISLASSCKHELGY